MRVSILMVLLILLPVSVNAEVHKYKDAKGKWVYSDVAPPSSVKQEVIGTKTFKPKVTAPLPVVETSVKDKSLNGLTKEQAAAKRQESAEQEKRNNEVKVAQDKDKETNCKIAKANLVGYSQGGRIYNMNEKGERDYLDDKGLEAAKIRAQQDIDSNCN